MKPNEEIIKFGQRVELLRTEKGMSEYCLAQKIDESVYYVTQIENGLIDPTIAEIANIIMALETTWSEFFSSFEN